MHMHIIIPQSEPPRIGREKTDFTYVRTLITAVERSKVRSNRLVGRMWVDTTRQERTKQIHSICTNDARTGNGEGK